jgi:hypothetical protein
MPIARLFSLPLKMTSIARWPRRLRARPAAPRPTVETRTDADGRFHLEPPQYFDPFISTGDRQDAWSLCFNEKNAVAV